MKAKTTKEFREAWHNHISGLFGLWHTISDEDWLIVKKCIDTLHEVIDRAEVK